MDTATTISAPFIPPAIALPQSPPPSLPVAAPSTTDKPSLSSIASAGLRASPVPVSAKSLASALGQSRSSPKPFTGEAALLDEKRRRQQEERENASRTSPNPSVATLGAVFGQMGGMSRPEDAPPPPETQKLSKGMAVAASVIDETDSVQLDRQLRASPIAVSDLNPSGSATTTVTAPSPDTFETPSSVSHAGSLRSVADSTTATANNAPSTPAHLGPQPPSSEEHYSSRALTYPGPLPPDEQSGGPHSPSRGMSLPTPGYGQDSPRSPSAKKHKCPYCATDFTRHHNLKSHLLTHSQEKPYVCSTCQNRFRRLHDLKRHTKLHTGERPHRCLRCGRQFARGDALARHNKGSGGCAGRRSSMGSFVGDDEFDGPSDSPHDGGRAVDEPMEGIVYNGEGASARGIDHSDPNGNENIEERNRGSLPMIKAHEPSAIMTDAPPHALPAPDQTMYQSAHPRTYPPAMGKYPNSSPSMSQPGTLHPPNHSRGPNATSQNNANRTLSPKSAGQSLSTATASGATNPSVFSQGMTESPKPLSPGAVNSHILGHSDGGRHRSPSYTHHTPRLPPTINPNAPQLPPLGPPEGRHSLTGQSPGPQPLNQAPAHSGHSNTTASGNGTSLNSYHSHSGGSSAGGLPPTPSFDSNRSMHRPSDGEAASFNSDRLWAYVRSLESRVNSLQSEVEHLRAQVGSSHPEPAATPAKPA